MSKQAWLLVAAILGTSVSVHAVAITWAVGAQVDLVREDYYEHGETFDAELAARRKAAEVGFGLVYSGRTLHLTAKKPELLSETMDLLLYRPNDRSADRRLALVEGQDGWLAVCDLQPGTWHIRVEGSGQSPVVWRSTLRVGAEGQP